MHLEIIRTWSEWQALEHEWNDLVTASAARAPFLLHEYLSAWWPTLGAGEWPHAELHVVLGREEDKLVAAAPLFFSVTHYDEPVLVLLGSDKISDYLDFLARPAQLPTFIARLLDHLETLEAPEWHALDLYNVLETSDTITELTQAALAWGWAITLHPIVPCLYIPLPGDWRTYLANQLDKKSRHEIERKLRRTAEGGDMRWYFATDPRTFEDDIDVIFQFMAQDEKKDRLLTPEMRLQMKAILHAARRAGWLRLAFLEIGGVKAAACILFDYDNKIWVYNSTYDRRFHDRSPGCILLAWLMQWAIEQQRTIFDFMRGTEAYKYDMGIKSRNVVRVTIRRWAV